MQRDHEGRVTRLVQPDPDGEGPLPAPETLFAYDSHGNLLEITHSARRPAAGRPPGLRGSPEPVGDRRQTQ